MKSNLKISVIGGGSGISVILAGLKTITSDVSAIVTVADDGGSSGVLREDFGMLPPGDIRNCIIALSDADQIMRELMQFRFKDNQMMNQSLGNIIIAALSELTGSFEKALSHIHKIFAVKGRVLPVSFDDIQLIASLKDGTRVQGESAIPVEVLKRETAIKSLDIKPKSAKVNPSAIDAILDSDIVLIGPGSLYTSILPNLLISGVKEAIRDTNAKIVFCSNLATQKGETENLNLISHLEIIENSLYKNSIDIILTNKEKISEKHYSKYANLGSKLLYLDKKSRNILADKNIKIIEENCIEVKNGYIRHDAVKIAEILLNQVETKIFKRQKKSLWFIKTLSSFRIKLIKN